MFEKKRIYAKINTNMKTVVRIFFRRILEETSAISQPSTHVSATDSSGSQRAPNIKYKSISGVNGANKAKTTPAGIKTISP